jgi:hypothetical protein
METIERFLDAMRPHWNTLALTVTWLGIAVVYLRRRAHWRRKTFLAQVNFSLNYVVGRHLAMRTLIESPAHEVWLNDYGVHMIFAAAQKTTVEQPFILLRDAADRDFVNRAVLNVLSERFAEAFVASALGIPVRSGTFLFAITCEKYDKIRTLKLRVLVIQEDALAELFGPANRAAALEVNNPIYRARLETLRGLYDLHLKDQGQERPALGRVELGIVVPPATLPAEVVPSLALSSASAIT